MNDWLSALNTDLAARGLVVVEKKRVDLAEMVVDTATKVSTHTTGKECHCGIMDKLRDALAAYREAGK